MRERLPAGAVDEDFHAAVDARWRMNRLDMQRRWAEGLIDESKRFRS